MASEGFSCHPSANMTCTAGKVHSVDSREGGLYMKKSGPMSTSNMFHLLLSRTRGFLLWLGFQGNNCERGPTGMMSKEDQPRPPPPTTTSTTNDVDGGTRMVTRRRWQWKLAAPFSTTAASEWVGRGCRCWFTPWMDTQPWRSSAGQAREGTGAIRR